MGFNSATEEIADSMTLDEYLMEREEATYLLKVSNNSMAEAGILSGDLVVVERGREARVGDIVVAEIEGEYTLQHYADLWPDSRLEAVVRAVVRKYK